MSVRIITGDCRDVLAELPAESVHMCCTSPPYWGLRDYRVAGQIGLEPDFRDYIATIVEVFRAVRRVLRSDGVVFLNLGDSYASSSTYNAPRTMHTAAGWKQPGKGPNAHVYGTSGKDKSNSRPSGSISTRLCDACQAAGPPVRSPHNGRSLASAPFPSLSASSHAHTVSLPGRAARSDSLAQSAHSEAAILDLQLSVYPEAAPPPAALASTTLQCAPPPPGECWRCDNCGACLAVLRSSSRDAAACVCRSAAETGTPDYNQGSASPSAARRNRNPSIAGSDSILSPYGYSTTAYLKPKDLIGIPWRVAFALQEDGWWLRRDIIWAKPNPMPESCTDRCTSAHEYLFHLSKSATYYYDADAIRERAGDDAGPGIGGWATGDDHSAAGHNVADRDASHGTLYRRPNSPGAIKSPHGQGFTRRAGIGAKGNANGFRGGSYVGGKPGPRVEHGNQPNEGFSRNKRSVWTIATAPFSGARLMRDASGGSGRKASADCPLHGDQSKLASSVQGDARPAAYQPARNRDIDSHHAPGLFDAPVPIETRHVEDFAPDSSGLPAQPCARSASEHSKGSRRTARAPETSPHETAAALSAGHIGGNEPLPGIAATFGHIPESKSGEDCGPCAPATGRAVQTASDSARICTCEEDNTFTDHFAVFPPALVEPCILAGCPRGGVVLDPFGGAGTTGLVADRLGRNAVLIELNETYSAMARRRIEGDAGLFARVVAE